MIKLTSYDAVNWIDGMKISQKHLDAHTNFILDGLREVRTLVANSFNYGLLPLDFKKQDHAIFDILDSLTGDAQLTIKNCRALTPSGFQIELIDFTTNLKELIPQVGEELSQQRLSYYLIISVNPFDKIPHGTLDLEETPPRYPYTRASYRIALLPTSSFDACRSNSEGNFIVFAKVFVQGDSIQMDLNFIPPCTSLHSHPLLLNHYAYATKAMAMLQKYAVKIIQKNSMGQQNVKLASSVKQLCYVLIQTIGSGYFHFKNVVPHVSPLYFVGCFSQLAILLYQVTQVLSPADLEEMLHYFGEWSDVAPNIFLNQLTNVAEIKYQHTDCGTHLNEVQIFLRSLESIFLRLSELDYIGQRKENIIVNEFEVMPTPKSNRSWSVLD